MYAQQSPRRFSIPQNYGGSAFPKEEPPPPVEAETLREDPPSESPTSAEEQPSPLLPTGVSSSRFGLARLLGRGRGFDLGGEELLLIGLCLLLLQSDTKDDLLLLLLFLLLIQ